MASSEVITCKFYSSVLFPDLCFSICSYYCLNQIIIIFLKHDTSVIPQEAAHFTVSNSIIYEFGYITLLKCTVLKCCTLLKRLWTGFVKITFVLNAKQQRVGCMKFILHIPV